MMTPRIPLAVPVLRGNERAYLEECAMSAQVSSVGPFVSRFERELASWVGAQHAVACGSGTAALHLSMLALAVRPGDDVLVSDLTFIASANPARYCGANVVLVDADPRGWCLDPALVEEELDRRRGRGLRMPAAIVVVHVFGQLAALDRILPAAAACGVPVLEDAAEALGAQWTSAPLNARQAGTVGEIGIYSFNGNKVLTTGGGGMVVTSDGAKAAKMRHLSTQARVPGSDYVHDAIGFNYRLSNISAALGLAQLECLPELLARKRVNAERYAAAFGGDRLVKMVPDPAGTRGSAWLNTVLLPSRAARDHVRASLAARDIESRPVWPPLHLQQPYLQSPVLGGGKVAANLADRGLSLPSSADLTDSELSEVAEVVVQAAHLGPAGSDAASAG
ncbi:MAG TPA: aminotransferase class I/II-fold pyridoxal phosphate-dependent enzyme [Candidatus Binatia bacterium]|nr:aminotransferase class I/II-fold pyridoxal phosphate-dependent enzyme [Candidatus Binatia bacterium]